MRNEGLYIRLLPDGTIRRRLVTILGEAPLEDTTIAAELIKLNDTNNVPMYQAIKEIWAYTSTVDRSLKDLQEFERVLGAYPVCTLCRDHERAGFVEGIKIGMQLSQEIK